MLFTDNLPGFLLQPEINCKLLFCMTMKKNGFSFEDFYRDSPTLYKLLLCDGFIGKECAF